MKKIWDKVFRKFQSNKHIMIFLFTLLFMGVLFGSFFATKLNQTDIAKVETSLQNFFDLVKQNKLNPFTTFFQSFGANIAFILGIWLLGISVIGIPVMIVLYFMKAFTIGFTIASMIQVYQWKGLIYGLLYVFPHQIINLLLFTFLMMYAISLSITIIKAILKKGTIDFGKILNRYLFVLGFSACILIFTTLCEIYLMPFLFQIILPILK